MNGLPGELAGPLFYRSPVPWRTLAVLAALLFVVFAVWLWRRWVARRPAPRPRPAPPAPAPEPGGIRAAIEALRRRSGGPGVLRRACHELSALLRGYFERLDRRAYSTLTAAELRRALGDTRRTRFFAALADLQFGRPGPSRNDLHGICDLALELVGEPREKKKGKRRSRRRRR